ncbi:GNAT family N-acetyltransferase [Kitasatospora sp. NPDC094015]|uniref:GNAT family N-acetyltransferase n=1 Tax=Kitasatospora sp. NPDC094015 TaxID=3155205 RepID=UPI003324DB94
MTIVQTAPARHRAPERRAVPPLIRIATARDAPALYVLSAPFMRSGELRPRTLADYRTGATEFLLVAAPGKPAGCVALRRAAPAPDHPAAGIVHNLCVDPARQGSGLGAQLVAAVLARAEDLGLRTLYTASTGSAVLFLRAGFQEVPAALAPPAWAAALDPARSSRVYRHELPAPPGPPLPRAGMTIGI